MLASESGYLEMPFLARSEPRTATSATASAFQNFEDLKSTLFHAFVWILKTLVASCITGYRCFQDERVSVPNLSAKLNPTKLNLGPRLAFFASPVLIMRLRLRYLLVILGSKPLI